MKIGIASDHHGVQTKEMLKKYLEKKGHTVTDVGTNSSEIVHFQDYAINVGERVISGEFELGILFCGTGIGMSIAANKVKGVRAAKIDSIKEAGLAKEHNNANIITMASTKSNFEIKDIVDKFLSTKVNDNPRYKYRNQKIEEYENAL